MPVRRPTLMIIPDLDDGAPPLTREECSDVVQRTPLVSRPFHGGETSMAWLILAAFLGVMGTLAVIGAFGAIQRYRERRAKNNASRTP